MIELLSIPDRFASSANQTKFDFRVTKDGQRAYGRKNASSSITFSNKDFFYTGDSVKVNWTDADDNAYIVELNAVEEPSTFNELPSQMTTLENYTSTVAKVLNAHPSLAPYFSASVETDTVRLSAKNAGNWTVTFDLSGVQNNNLVAVDEARADDDTPTGYRFEVELHIESDDTINVIPLTPSLDANGYVSVDVKGILEEEMKRRKLPRPSASTRTPYTYSTGFQYYLRYRENYHQKANKAWSITKALKVVPERFATTDITVDNSIISRHQRQIGMHQPEFISWYNYTNQPVSPYVEAKVTYQNELTSTYKYYDVNQLVGINTITVFPISLPALDLNGIDVKKYSVKVKTTENEMEKTLSQSRNFSPVCDASCTRYILYRDLSGVLITVKFSGRTAKSLEVDRYDSIRVLQAGDEREIFQWDYDFREVFRYRSGYMSRAEVETLEEMLIVNEAWEVQETANIPIHIISKKFKITECFQYLHFIEFDATVAFLDYLNPPTDGEGVIVPEPIVGRYYWNLNDGTDWEQSNGQGWEHEGAPPVNQ